MIRVSIGDVGPVPPCGAPVQTARGAPGQNRGVMCSTQLASYAFPDAAKDVVVPMPFPVDLVTQAADCVRPHLDRCKPIGERVKLLWAAVVAARDFGASDVIEKEFLQLAHETGVFADLGRHADADLQHVIRWAFRDLNPFR